MANTGLVLMGRLRSSVGPGSAVTRFRADKRNWELCEGPPLDQQRTDEPLADALADLMARRGLTQSELARRSGVSQAHVSRVMRGESHASMAAIEALSGALGVAPSHFLDFRLEAVMRDVGRSPELLDELFEQSLSPAEWRAWESAVYTSKRLGRALESLIAERGLTLDELAEDAELPPGYLRRIIGRDSMVGSVERVERLARALDVPPEFFLEYRAALLREWLREDPPRLDALFSKLYPGDEVCAAKVAALDVTLAPYVAWTARRLRDPRHTDRSEILRTIVEIVRVEGPVVGTRVYSVYSRAAGVPWMTKDVRSLFNRASAEAVRRGLLLAENETGEQTQKDLVLRVPRTSRVVPRQRGGRQFCEIPLSELRWVIARMKELTADEDIVCRQVLVAYDMDALTEREQQHLERALSRGGEVRVS